MLAPTGVGGVASVVAVQEEGAEEAAPGRRRRRRPQGGRRQDVGVQGVGVAGQKGQSGRCQEERRQASRPAQQGQGRRRQVRRRQVSQGRSPLPSFTEFCRVSFLGFIFSFPASRLNHFVGVEYRFLLRDNAEFYLVIYRLNLINLVFTEFYCYLFLILVFTRFASVEYRFHLGTYRLDLIYRILTEFCFCLFYFKFSATLSVLNIDCTLVSIDSIHFTEYLLSF